MDDAIQLKRYTGGQAARFFDELAELRISVFREYPYLYDGSVDFEREYLQRYFDSKRSVVLIARHGERIVGASTAIPLSEEGEQLRRPFWHAGLDIRRIFYFGESILLPEFRGHGIGHRFFEEREAHARSFEGFQFCTFCAVVRPDDHPRKPEGYTPLDTFWEGHGYERSKELFTNFTWQDLDEDSPSPKRMVFWMREFTDVQPHTDDIPVD